MTDIMLQDMTMQDMGTTMGLMWGVGLIVFGMLFWGVALR